MSLNKETTDKTNEFNEELLHNSFEDSWNLWYHHKKNNWKIDGYRNIFTINTILNFWEIFNNFDTIGGLYSKHFFLMRDNITPLWEDDCNAKGGNWSFKINTFNAPELWLKLSAMILGETLIQTPKGLNPPPPKLVNGLSICVKNENITIIKIWNKNSKYYTNDYLPEEMVKKYSVLYKKHTPEY